MCTMSMVFDEYGKHPLAPWVPQPTTIDPAFPWTIASAPKTPIDLFEELVQAAKRLDESLGLPDCEDPGKAAWLDKVREVVRQTMDERVEKRLASSG